MQGAAPNAHRRHNDRSEQAGPFNAQVLHCLVVERCIDRPLVFIASPVASTTPGSCSEFLDLVPWTSGDVVSLQVPAPALASRNVPPSRLHGEIDRARTPFRSLAHGPAAVVGGSNGLKLTALHSSCGTRSPVAQDRIFNWR